DTGSEGQQRDSLTPPSTGSQRVLMQLRGLVHLLLLTAGMFLAGPLAAEEETSPTLLLSVTEWTGLAAGGLEVTFSPSGGEPEVARTDRRGTAAFHTADPKDRSLRISIPAE